MYEFFNVCVRMKVGYAIHLGDLFDKCSPTIAQEKLVLQWCNEFERAGIPLYIMVGNHDVTNKVEVPSALECIRVSPFKRVRVVDRPLRLSRGVVMLPFPSPGLYESQDAYDRDIHVCETDTVCTHLNVIGSKVGEEGNSYRAAAHYVPSRVIDDACVVIGGHIHKPQKVGSNVVIVGSAERMTFDEENDCKRFLLHDRYSDHAESKFVARQAIELLTLEIDVTQWGSGRVGCTTSDVVCVISKKDLVNKVVRVKSFVDESTIVDWKEVEGRLYEKGAKHVFVMPRIKVSKEDKKYKQERKTSDPMQEAAAFIKSKIKSREERSVLLQMFKDMQKEVEHEGTSKVYQ
jgi:DNA repair exonuclease SbcCD nuclease subunit